jgi:hypothetical protein
VKGARALRASPHLEHLEQRYVLTNSLVVVPSPAVNQAALWGTAAIAPNDIWAVGGMFTQAGPKTLAEHFDGNSWQVVPPPQGNFNATLLGVAGVASNDVWAVGASGIALFEHWDGSSWTIIDGPPVRNAALSAVTAIASNDVWAVGSGQLGNALVEHWDGSSWSVVSSSAFTGVDGLRSISADAGNDVWAASQQGIVLHFDGTSWTRIDTQTQVTLGSVTALSPTDVWAVGSVIEAYDDNGDVSSARAAIEHWDGSQWQEVPSLDPRPGGQGISGLSGVAAISPTDIWAVGLPGSGNTLTEHWDGTSWSIIPSPDPTPNRDGVFAVTSLSDGTVAAVGNQAAGNQPLILQNPESAPPGPGAAVPPAPLFVDASADPRLSFAGPSTISNVAKLDAPLRQDRLNARSVDPVFVAGQPDPTLCFARDRSLVPQGPEDPLGRMDALDQLFTEWFVVPALAG